MSAKRLTDKIEQREETTPITAQSPIKEMTEVGKGKDRQISAKVNSKTYKLFTDINRANGLSNNSALNMIISQYVRSNKEILKDEDML